MTFDLPFLWSPALSCTEALLPCTFLFSHTGQPGCWGWQRPDRNTNTLIVSKRFSNLAISLNHLHPCVQCATSAAWSHWSGEKIINDVRKQEVITVGCNLIPIMYVESPTCALRRKERPLRSPLMSDSDGLWWPCGQSGMKGGQRGEVTGGGGVHSERR